MTRLATTCVLTLALGASAPQAAAQEAVPVDSVGATTDPFPVGETLVYDAKFGFITLGAGMMRIAGVDTVRGDAALHIVFKLKGGGFLYQLENRMDSWVAVDDFTSRRFVQDFLEGGNRRYAEYEIYPDSGYYAEEGVDSVRATSAAPLDDAAFFYFLRTVDLEVGERYEFERYFRPDRNPVVLEVLRRDTLDVPAGRFATLVIRPTIKGRGILAESQDPLLWLSDDARRLVVQLKSTFASIATITLRLTDVTDTVPEKLADPEDEPDDST